MPSENPDHQPSPHGKDEPVSADAWSLATLAMASGETPDDLRTYVHAGLLDQAPDGSFAPNALSRTTLIQFARSRGISNQQLAATLAIQGDLLNRLGSGEPPSPASLRIEELSHHTALPDDVIEELALTLDWRHVLTDDDVAAAHRIAHALQLGMPREAVMQLIQVFSDTSDRLADAVVRTFHDYVHEHHRAQGITGTLLLDTDQRLAQPLLELIEPTAIYFHRRALARALREDLLRHLAEPDTPPTKSPGEEHLTVLFADLSSFTPLTATMGDHAAADILRTFGLTVRRHAANHHGRIIKQIGDEFMITFTQPSDAIAFGLAMDHFVNTQPHFPALHIGAHTGSVLYREGDYVGGTVNLAARVASAGTPGQFLITQELHAAAANYPQAKFNALHPQRLKGIPDPVQLVDVEHATASVPQRPTDPVCGMRLHPAEVAATTQWRGNTFEFCSQICRNAFTAQPKWFVHNDGRPIRHPR